MQRIIQKRARGSIALPGTVSSQPSQGMPNQQPQKNRALDYVQGIEQKDVVPWPKEWTTGYFGPGQPVSPTQNQEDEPRIFQYVPGYNLMYVPRTGFNLIDFGQLRTIADISKEIRLCVELLKREIRGFDWHIRPDDLDDIKKYKDEIREMTKFFNRPDGELYFDQWINTALEDILVIDAFAINNVKTRNGKKVAALEIVDGATIKPLLDIRGKSPRPPLPAYMQIMYGTPWLFLDSNEFTYQKFNPSSRHPYGRSAIENIIYFVNMAIRRDIFNMNYFTSGNIPEGLMGAPKEWTTDQIRQFQVYWDTLLKGNPDLARTLRVVPADATKVYEFRRPNFDSGWEEWLFRVCSWAFGVSPSEFGIMASHGLGDSGFTEGQANVQFRMGVGPLMRYLRAILTNVIERAFNKPYLRFEWVTQDPMPDKLAEAQVAQIYIQNGVWSIDDVRARNGDKPLGIPHFFMIGGQPILLSDLLTGKLNMNPGGEGPGNVEGAVGEDGAVDAKQKGGEETTVDNAHIAQAPEKEKQLSGAEAKAMGTSEVSKSKVIDGILHIVAEPEIAKFMKKSIASFKRGDGANVPFQSEFLSKVIIDWAKNCLSKANSVSEIKQVFSDAKMIAKIIPADESVEVADRDNHSNLVQVISVGDEKWYWKPSSGDSEKMMNWVGHNMAAGEIAYYLTAKQLGFTDIVPETVEDKIDGEYGTRQAAIDKTSEDEKPNMYGLSPENIEKIGLLDFITGQQDRVKRNYVRSGDVAYAIDNSLCFSANHGMTSKRYWGNSAFSGAIGGHKISPWAKQAIKKFLDDIKGNTEYAKEISRLLTSPSIVYAISRARALSNSDVYPSVVLENLK